MDSEKKTKVLMYYSFGDRIGGPLTYIKSLMNSELKERFTFETCFQNMAPGGFRISLLLRMIGEIKAASPDIVHVHGLQSEGFYGVLSARLAGCRNIVTTVHGFAHDANEKYSVKWFLYRYLAEPLTLRWSDKVYCVCRYASERPIIVRNTRKNGFGFIHNAVGALHATQTREEIRSRWNIAPQETVFVISGRVSKDKGFDILAKAVKLLGARQERAFRLLVIGDGEYAEAFREEMKEEIESGFVIMTGQTDRVADHLNAADVFVLPSYHENLPIALLEAGKMGLPCIASAVGGIPEIVRDGESGFLIGDARAVSYADKMELLMEDILLRQRMGKALQKDIEEKLSMSTMCRKIEEVYVHDGRSRYRRRKTK